MELQVTKMGVGGISWLSVEVPANQVEIHDDGFPDSYWSVFERVWKELPGATLVESILSGSASTDAIYQWVESVEETVLPGIQEPDVSVELLFRGWCRITIRSRNTMVSVMFCRGWVPFCVMVDIGQNEWLTAGHELVSGLLELLGPGQEVRLSEGSQRCLLAELSATLQSELEARNS